MYQMGPMNIISNINAQLPWSVSEERQTEGRPKSSILMCLLWHLFVVARIRMACSCTITQAETRVWGPFNSVSCPSVSPLREHPSLLFAFHSKALCVEVAALAVSPCFSLLSSLSPSCLPSSLPPSSPVQHLLPSHSISFFFLLVFPFHLSSLRFPFPLLNFKNWL